MQLNIIIPLVHIHLNIPRPRRPSPKTREHAGNGRAINPGVTFCDTLHKSPTFAVDSRHALTETDGEAA